MNLNSLLNRFPDEESAVNFLEEIRWNGEIFCPYCSSNRITFRTATLRHHCNQCNIKFTVTTGTKIRSTNIPIRTWLICITLIVNAKKGISARQLGRHLGVTKNSAWYMGMRLRNSMMDGKPLLDEFRELFSASTMPKKLWEKRPSCRSLIVRGQLLATLLTQKFGKTVRLSFSPGKNPRLKKKEQVLNLIPNASGDFRHNYLKALFNEKIGKGYWTLLPRGVVGQFHRVSARFFHAYVDELAYKKLFKHDETAFFELICRLVKGASVKLWYMDKKASA